MVGVGSGEGSGKSGGWRGKSGEGVGEGGGGAGEAEDVEGVDFGGEMGCGSGAVFPASGFIVVVMVGEVKLQSAVGEFSPCAPMVGVTVVVVNCAHTDD